jgi:hypothetical protein
MHSTRQLQNIYWEVSRRNQPRSPADSTSRIQHCSSRPQNLGVSSFADSRGSNNRLYAKFFRPPALPSLAELRPSSAVRKKWRVSLWKHCVPCSAPLILLSPDWSCATSSQIWEPWYRCYLRFYLATRRFHVCPPLRSTRWHRKTV